MNKVLKARRERDDEFIVLPMTRRGATLLHSMASVYSMIDSWPAAFHCWCKTWSPQTSPAERESIVDAVNSSSMSERLQVDGALLGYALNLTSKEETQHKTLPVSSPETTDAERTEMKRAKDRKRKAEKREKSRGRAREQITAEVAAKRSLAAATGASLRTITRRLKCPNVSAGV